MSGEVSHRLFDRGVGLRRQHEQLPRTLVLRLCYLLWSLFKDQVSELDRKKREAMLHQIQQILHDRVIFAPIWENGFIRASGPRAEEPGLTLIPAFPYAAPAEDLRVKRP